MTEFKVGDRVRIKRGVSSHMDPAFIDELGTVGGINYGMWVVTLDNPAFKEIARLFHKDEVVPVKARPTLADAINLNPLTKRILSHLESRGSISQMEALISYGTPRLAAQVFKLKKAGWPVTTEIREDETGHRYARYKLAA